MKNDDGIAILNGLFNLIQFNYSSTKLECSYRLNCLL